LIKPEPNRLPVKAVLLIGSTLTIMAGAIISPSLPSMLEHFADVQNAEYLVRLVLTLPALFVALFSPLAGYVVDRFGRRRVLITGLLLYGIIGSSAALLDSIYQILITRIFLGIAVAAIMTTITTLIADYFDGRTRARFMGLQAASIGIGGMIYLTTGGLLAEIAWNAPFVIYLTALVLLPLAITSIFEPVVASSGVSHTSMKTSHLNDREHLKEVLPLMVFIYVLMFLVQAFFYMVPTQLPFYMRSLTGASPLQIGVAIASSTFFSALASLVYIRISIGVVHIRLVIISLLLVGVGFYILSISVLYVHILVGLFFSGTGVGLFMPNITLWLSEVAPPTYRGRSLGILTTSIFLGHFSSLLIIQPFITQFGFSSTFTYTAAFIGLLIVFLIIAYSWNFLKLRDVN